MLSAHRHSIFTVRLCENPSLLTKSMKAAGWVIGVSVVGCVNFVLLHRVMLAPATQPHAAAEHEIALNALAQPSAPSPSASVPSGPPAFALDTLHPPERRFWARADELAQSSLDAPWLTELRDEWLLDDIPGAPRLPPIPEKLHQTWKDAAPPKAQFSPRWPKSLRDQNRGWTYTLWTDADNRALVASEYPSLLPVYDSYASPIQRADVARYVIAHARGGVYADLDTQCFKPFAPLLEGASLVLSYKAGRNFSRGACNSIFASAAGHPFWLVVFDVLRNRSGTPLSGGHTAVLYSTGPAVLREALRRLLRLPAEDSLSEAALALARRQLGLVVLDAVYLHPVTAERRREDEASTRPREAVCTHHFVSSWVAHDRRAHESTARRRRAGDQLAAMHASRGQPVKLEGGGHT